VALRDVRRIARRGDVAGGGGRVLGGSALFVLVGVAAAVAVARASLSG
jgi:hypothetical protein